MNSKTKPQFTDIIRAMRSPEAWRAYKMIWAREIANREMNESRTNSFAKYLEDCFISICDEMKVFEMANDWAKKTASEKLAVAGGIIHRLVSRVRSDMASGRAKKYNDTTPKSVPDISVSRATDGLMSVSHNGRVNVNPDFSRYNNLVNFLMDLRHEFSHIVDIFFPSLSPLNSEDRDLAMAFYVSPHEDKKLYAKNLLERNANVRRLRFGEKLRAKIALLTYNRMRPAMNPVVTDRIHTR